MDREAWRATVHGIAKGRTWLSTAQDGRAYLMNNFSFLKEVAFTNMNSEFFAQWVEENVSSLAPIFSVSFIENQVLSNLHPSPENIIVASCPFIPGVVLWRNKSARGISSVSVVVPFYLFDCSVHKYELIMSISMWATPVPLAYSGWGPLSWSRTASPFLPVRASGCVHMRTTRPALPDWFPLCFSAPSLTLESLTRTLLALDSRPHIYGTSFRKRYLQGWRKHTWGPGLHLGIFRIWSSPDQELSQLLGVVVAKVAQSWHPAMKRRSALLSLDREETWL